MRARVEMSHGRGRGAGAPGGYGGRRSRYLRLISLGSVMKYTFEKVVLGKFMV